MKDFPPASILGLCGWALFSSSALPQTPLRPPNWEQSIESQRKDARDAKCSIAVDVQMLALPKDLALLLLPDLQSSDASKVSAAVVQLQDLLKKKQAVLMGWPRVFTTNGQYAVSDTTLEERYPSEISPPLEPQTFAVGPSPKLPLSITPNSMEIRNAGISLAVIPRVCDEGRGSSILLGVNVDRTTVLAFENYELGKTKEGHFARLGVPKFSVSRTRTAVLMHSGKPTLIGVHMLASPVDYIELVIACAIATPLR